MRNGVTALLDYKTVPISLKLSIKLLFYFSRDVAKVLRFMILEGLQGRNNRVLHLVCCHVGPLD